MSTLSVDSINGQTVASKVSIPGHIVGAAVSQITANSSRGSAQAFDDDFVFANYTPKLTTSTVIIQGVANFDSANSAYCRYRWVINGANFLSTPGYTTPSYTHQFYSNTSMNAYGYMPSTIITSVNNTDGSAITVKCQGMVNTGTLYRNGASGGQAGSPSSVLYLEIAP